MNEGKALVSPDPVGFFGGVDPETGVVVEAGHPLEGACVAGRVLVFPVGKGSTVGSYILYRLKKNHATLVVGGASTRVLEKRRACWYYKV